MSMYKIYNKDCFDVIRRLPDRCVDLVCTDPPYLIKRTTGGGQLQQIHKAVPCSGGTEAFEYSFGL